MATQTPRYSTPTLPVLLPVLLLSLLGGCSVDPLHLPAPVEQRNPANPGVRQAGGSTAVVTPQPDYSPITTPVEASGRTAPDSEPARSEPLRDGTITALITRANDQAAAGQYQAAAGSIERAIRIAPDDAGLWYELARIRLRQGELAEAEELAIKSRSMASGQPALQARNWRLVAVVRQQRGDPDGAEQALETARALENNHS
jgi:tetratricopeptide (TPR) repeat protein